MKELLVEMLEDCVHSLVFLFIIFTAALFLPYILSVWIAWLIIAAILFWIENRRYLKNKESS